MTAASADRPTAEPATPAPPPSPTPPPTPWARLAEDVATVQAHDPAAGSAWEVVSSYPGLHAVWAHRLVTRPLWTRGRRGLARFASHLARFATGVEIHPGATLGRRLFIDHGMGVVIGETAAVGDDCTIYQGVTLGGTSLARGTKRHPTLGNGVVVGGGAKVLGNFTVGDGARVGSNAVVVREVPPGATAVGVPAKIVAAAETAGAIPDPRLAEAARRIGFDAYGVTLNMPDPVTQALTKLVEHVQRQDAEIARLSAALCAMGAVARPTDLPPMPVPDFCAEEMAKNG